jgi:hypothetical protein
MNRAQIFMRTAISVLMVLGLVGALASCGMKDLSSQEQHSVIAGKLTSHYIWAHGEFQRLEKELPESAQDELEALRGPMNDVKDLLDSYLGLVIAEQTKKATEKKHAVKNELATLTSRIVQLGLKYGVEIKEQPDEQ